ncbi:MAG: Re/Si-specific NAD(P)(+) transhydrogenase subunit alpha [Candidatus Marinimicrobia bacterium]|nr:Re/Si-specific NAD(P)(+) transhydrogenase subunit alpha [Candidatus Neomarinimicrobiota bacterium]
MIIGVPAESFPDEKRVALVPAFIPNLAKVGLEVHVEQGAGLNAGFPDSAYVEQGAHLVAERSQLFSSADVLLQVHGLGFNSITSDNDLELVHSRQVVIGLFNPLGNPGIAEYLAEKDITTFALELVPRISRAQPMDVLSSMATIAGYKAVMLAAGALNKIYPMMITAAGTISPSRVFIVGAGVAGLQAIATSRRLGAVVQSYDIRPAVKEQVESLGAKFLELKLETEEAETSGGYAKAMDEEFYRRQREMMKQVVAESDVVITTAAVPGKKAPVLITEEMVQGMHPGSVIVDLAAEGGGNCDLTRPGETIEVHGVHILGPLNLPSTIPYHASQMYAKNVTTFLENLVKDGELNLNLEDPIIKDTLLTHKGEVVNPMVRELLGLPVSSQPASNERSDS